MVYSSFGMLYSIKECQRDSMLVNRCLKEVSRVFQDSFKGVSMKIEGCFKEASTNFQGKA